MKNINNQQIDILAEIINVASGNAATSLSKLLNKEINMTCPSVTIRKFEDVANDLGGNEELVIATLLKVIGDISGNVLMIVKDNDADFIAKELLEGLYEEYDEDMALSVIQEIGNILGNAYLISMGEFLNCNLLSSVPYLSVDMLFPVLTSSYIDANQVDDYIIDARCTLFQNDVEFKLNIFFILPSYSIKKIIDKANQLYKV